MKKVIKIFTIVLTLFSFLKITNAAIKTSFAECFVGINIDYQNDINLLGIHGDDLLDSTAEITYFKLSYETLIDENCDNIVSNSEKKEENKILYCADGTKSSPANDIKNGVYPKDKVPFKVCEIVESNAKKISYAYENGYGEYSKDYQPTKYLTGDYQKDYYITQSAIWYFTKPKEWMNNFDFSKGTYNNINNEISQKIGKLILDAEAANAGASLELETSSTKLTLTDDGKYYISSPIQLKGKYINSQINVTLNGITEAFATSDQNGTESAKSFNNNSTIYIKVPVENFSYDKEITIIASATNSINDSEVIQCGRGEESGYQPIIIHYPKNSTITDTLKLQNNTYTVQVSKQDITSGKEVKGATLIIKNSKADIVNTWVSDNTPKSINLDSGVYTLEETIAPEGYELSDTTIEFTINDEGKVLIDGKEVKDNLIIFENTPEPEQVPTGSALIYIAGTLCLMSLGISIFIIMKRNKI